MLEVRYATEEMAESLQKAVKAIANEARYLCHSTGFPVEETRKWVRKMIDRNDALFFAIDGDRVVGWCEITRSPREFYSHSGELAMGIVEGYRGRGLGSQLISRTIEYARRNGIERIELDVFESNARARRLYEKFGFKASGVKTRGKKHLGTYENVICMELLYIQRSC